MAVNERFLDYLPDLFQDAATADGETPFIEQFLKIFETLFFNFEKEIDQLPWLFDAWAVQRDFLPWLAGWFAFDLDSDWPEDLQRFLTSHINRIYAERGTVEGLEFILNSYPRFRNVKIHEKSDDLNAHEFKVTWESLAKPDENDKYKYVKIDIIKMHRVLDQIKPAHTFYDIEFPHPLPNFE